MHGSFLFESVEYNSMDDIYMKAVVKKILLKRSCRYINIFVIVVHSNIYRGGSRGCTGSKCTPSFPQPLGMDKEQTVITVIKQSKCIRQCSLSVKL